MRDVGQYRVSSKWVITEKVKDGKEIIKARLVARGFEENLQDRRTDSPTCSRQALRPSFATASSMRWNLYSLDVSCAFLQEMKLQCPSYDVSSWQRFTPCSKP